MLHKSTYTAGDALAVNGSLPPETPRKKRVLRGYKAQAALLQEAVERVVCSHESRRVSLIMEGVHLDVRFIMGLLSRHPAVVPFLIYISNEQKHRERFAVRSQHMTSAATLTTATTLAATLAAATLAAATLTAATLAATLATAALTAPTLAPAAQARHGGGVRGVASVLLTEHTRMCVTRELATLTGVWRRAMVR